MSSAGTCRPMCATVRMSFPFLMTAVRNAEPSSSLTQATSTGPTPGISHTSPSAVPPRMRAPWRGASWRSQERGFKAGTVGGAIKGANLRDWPLTLDDVEPYYARAEDKMGVTRTNGIPGLPGNNNFKVMYAGATKLGYKQVHTGNMAINSQQRDGRGSCLQIGFCFQGCKSGAKWSTLYNEIPQAQKHGTHDPPPATRTQTRTEARSREVAGWSITCIVLSVCVCVCVCVCVRCFCWVCWVW